MYRIVSANMHLQILNNSCNELWRPFSMCTKSNKMRGFEVRKTKRAILLLVPLVMPSFYCETQLKCFKWFFIECCMYCCTAYVRRVKQKKTKQTNTEATVMPIERMCESNVSRIEHDDTHHDLMYSLWIRQTWCKFYVFFLFCSNARVLKRIAMIINSMTCFKFRFLFIYLFISSLAKHHLAALATPKPSPNIQNISQLNRKTE